MVVVVVVMVWVVVCVCGGVKGGGQAKLNQHNFNHAC